jgi:hypothetical protein
MKQFIWHIREAFFLVCAVLEAGRDCRDPAALCSAGFCRFVSPGSFEIATDGFTRKSRNLLKRARSDEAIHPAHTRCLLPDVPVSVGTARDPDYGTLRSRVVFCWFLSFRVPRAVRDRDRPVYTKKQKPAEKGAA